MINFVFEMLIGIPDSEKIDRLGENKVCTLNKTLMMKSLIIVIFKLRISK